jgi:hypothetical protein
MMLLKEYTKRNDVTTRRHSPASPIEAKSHSESVGRPQNRARATAVGPLPPGLPRPSHSLPMRKPLSHRHPTVGPTPRGRHSNRDRAPAGAAAGWPVPLPPDSDSRD